MTNGLKSPFLQLFTHADHRHRTIVVCSGVLLSFALFLSGFMLGYGK